MGEGRYNGEVCFLTAYQIAVLVDKNNATLKGSLPIGGKGVGGESFAKEIAFYLSKDINEDYFNQRLEIHFFSTLGLEDFLFDGGNKPSASEFSMFRLLP